VGCDYTLKMGFSPGKKPEKGTYKKAPATIFLKKPGRILLGGVAAGAYKLKIINLFRCVIEWYWLIIYAVCF